MPALTHSMSVMAVAASNYVDLICILLLSEDCSYKADTAVRRCCIPFVSCLQVLLKKNSKPVELPTSGTVRKVKAEDLAPKANKGNWN